MNEMTTDAFRKRKIRDLMSAEGLTFNQAARRVDAEWHDTHAQQTDASAEGDAGDTRPQITTEMMHEALHDGARISVDGLNLTVAPEVAIVTGEHGATFAPVFQVVTPDLQFEALVIGPISARRLGGNPRLNVIDDEPEQRRVYEYLWRHQSIGDFVQRLGATFEKYIEDAGPEGLTMRTIGLVPPSA